MDTKNPAIHQSTNPAPGASAVGRVPSRGAPAGPNHSLASTNRALPGIIKPGRGSIPKVKVLVAPKPGEGGPPPGTAAAPAAPAPNPNS